MADKFYHNFGFGIGFAHKEDLLQITPTNQIKVEQGMVFHVKLSLMASVPNAKKNIVIAIGDTVLINKAGEAEVLTKGIPKKFS